MAVKAKKKAVVKKPVNMAAMRTGSVKAGMGKGMAKMMKK